MKRGIPMNKDVGEKCIFCFRDTSFGSGRFVNRMPASDDEYDGWACPECMAYECDRCNKPIGLDCDIDWEDEKIHAECLTPEEYIQYEKELDPWISPNKEHARRHGAVKLGILRRGI